MTCEQCKRAHWNSIVRGLALSALCIIIAFGTGYLANYIMPPICV